MGEPREYPNPQERPADMLPVRAPGPDVAQPDFVEQPAKLLRIGAMVREMLAEVRRAPLDTGGRKMLRDIHMRAIDELKEILSPPLIEELDEMTIPLTEEIPTESELRISQAQLVGWLEGLFHGIQAALMSQQMQMQAQLSELARKAQQPQVPERDRGQYL